MSTDNCVICGVHIPDVAPEATAHWGGPTVHGAPVKFKFREDVTIVAWTCSEPCTTTYRERNSK